MATFVRFPATAISIPIDLKGNIADITAERATANRYLSNRRRLSNGDTGCYTTYRV